MGLLDAWRGGAMTSGGNVFVKELGSPGGASTMVQFLQGKRLTADRVEAGIVLHSGHETMVIDAAGRMLEAQTDKQGRLQVTKLKA